MATGFSFLVLGILVHVVYLASIFDIYFTSPLVHGMSPYKSTFKPPAERLVLFVADGLRADKCFELDEHGKTRVPHLREIMEKRGCWGVSHTRVPTESRPGHVAVIAGFYEDVSAVAKGWKENPVQFDSTFNESRFTWAWGSPDILPMFAKGASGGHVFTSSYANVAEDFGDKDAAKLDTWVFNEVKQFFRAAKNNATLREMLSKGQIVFFLHLLGIDTNGHAHRPTSNEYLKNIALVDKGIQEMENIFEDFYNHDGKTAYIMTSDHGMTNWGSHGAGHPHETLTPLVAWGAGIRGPLQSVQGSFTTEEMVEWNVSHLKRTDVEQADIAPLMTSLVGVPFPLNSVGVLPMDYLENTEQYIAENLFMNSQQILAQYEVKELYRKETSLVFRPFKSLTGAKRTGIIRNIKQFLRTRNYKEAVNLSKELIDLSLEGLKYYQNYDRIFLEVVVTLGFLGWIACIVLQVIQEHTDVLKEASRLTQQTYSPFLKRLFVDIGSLVLALVIVILLLIESAPWLYYTYCLLPLLFWNRVMKRLHIFCAVFDYVHIKQIKQRVLFVFLFGAFFLEILVMSFFRREILSVGLLCFAVWPVSTKLLSCKLTTLCWFVGSATLAVFPLLPVVGREANYMLVTLAAVLTLAFFICMLFLCASGSDVLKIEIGKCWKILLAQGLLVASAIYIVNSTASSLRQKRGLPLVNQVGSWTIFLSSFLLPLINSGNLTIRLTSVALAFSSVYLLMSTAYEGLFLLVLVQLMGAWLVCEHKLSGKALCTLLETQLSSDETTAAPQPTWKVLTQGLSKPFVRKLNLEDLRCSYFFVFFIIVAFFGTGNIASINSFDPASVYCFLTVFSPFTMGSLLLCKVLIPFVIVTCAFDAIHVILSIPFQSLVLIVLAMTDAMGLHFFYLVQDYGSWLDIGKSISHYVIMMASIIFLLPIFGMARLFTGASLTLRTIKKRP